MLITSCEWLIALAARKSSSLKAFLENGQIPVFEKPDCMFLDENAFKYATEDSSAISYIEILLPGFLISQLLNYTFKADLNGLKTATSSGCSR